uniref:NADH dehydrogenase subunit 6 n=1 Tax=Sorineuchora bivitta TaxID=1928793 RepID=UPI00279F0E75|nr:NADH dehydrogenase subunit 6 [Sorineuchora bivitta]WGO57753.1 NADH dehydrogenase subunit 6 [Sorineuchora bivitta]
MKMMLTTMMTLSMVLLQIKHPMALGLILLMQTIIISLTSGLLSNMFWFSYILTLVFLGGMLVLFIYVTSIASNEMFSLSINMTVYSMTFILVMGTIMNNNILDILGKDSDCFMNINNTTSLNMIKLYNSPTNMINIMMASYLFITLIAVIKITENYKGPLRKMN